MITEENTAKKRASKSHVGWAVSLGLYVPLIRVDADHVDHDNWQHRLHYVLDSHTVHVSCIVLLIVDLMLVLVEYLVYIDVMEGKFTIIKENMAQFCDSKSKTYDYSKCVIPPDNEATESKLFMMELASIMILTLFFLETVGHMAAKGADYFADAANNWFHWFDAIVIITSLVLELNVSAESGFGLIIFARFWRLVRIVETVAAMEELEKEEQDEEGMDVY